MNFVIKLKEKPIYYIDYFLVFTFFSLTLYIYLFRYQGLSYYIRYIFLILAALRGYYFSIKKRFFAPIFLVGLFSISYILCNIYQNSVNLPLSQFIYTLCYIGLAVLLYEKCYGLVESTFLLIFCSGVIILRFIRGVNPNSILTYTSRNFISVIMLFILILYYLAVYNSGKEGYVYVLLPALVYFLICSTAYGRGGILTSAFVLGAFGFYFSFKTNNKYTSRGLRIFVLLIVVLIVMILFFSDQLTFLFGKFNENITDANRITIWETFFKNNTKSRTDLLFGSNAGLIRQDKNLHNSYLQCYADFGLITFIVIIILCIRSFAQGITHKGYYIIILMAALFLRAFTDRLFYSSYCEVFLYYFIMYWDYKDASDKNLKKMNKKNNSNNTNSE